MFLLARYEPVSLRSHVALIALTTREEAPTSLDTNGFLQE